MKINKSVQFTVKKKYKAGIAAAVPVLLAAGLLLALQLRPDESTTGAAAPMRSTTAQNTSTPVPASNAKPPIVVSAAIKLFMFGEEIHNFELQDNKSLKFATDAIMDGLIKSTAYPGADVESLDDKIVLTVQYNGEDTYHEYTIYDRGARHLIQSGDLASELAEKAYIPLKELAMGYRKPEAMTVVSGDNAIHAFGSAVSSQRKSDGLYADMRRYTPQQLENHIDSFTLDKSDSVPFTPYRNGRKVYGRYTVFDSAFNQIDHIEPSGLAPQTYLFTNAKPGKYIVLLETSYEDDEFTYQMQYFFGVNYE